MFKQQLHFCLTMKWSSNKTPLSVNVRDGKKETRRKECFLPPPKNDCSNNTSSQTTTRDRNKFWYGLSLSLLALSITTSFFVFPRTLFSCVEKKGKATRSRCVIKCNLNWMAKERDGIESILSWWILWDKCLNTVEWILLIVYTTC